MHLSLYHSGFKGHDLHTEIYGIMKSSVLMTMPNKNDPPVTGATPIQDMVNVPPSRM